MYFYFSMQESNLFLSLKAGSPISNLSKSSPKALRMQDDFCWKLYESRVNSVESPTKTLQKQDDFCWKLYESRITFVGSSTKTGWISLGALRKLSKISESIFSESRIIFVESSTKIRWLSLKALQKPFKKSVNCNNTKFCDKIAYVGDPSFPRRPWPFGDRRLCNFWHTASSIITTKRMAVIINRFISHYHHNVRLTFILSWPANCLSSCSLWWW